MNQINVVNPSLMLFQFLGLNAHKVKNNKAQESRNLKIFTTFQAILFGGLFVRGLYEGKMYINGRKNSVGNTVDFVQLLGVRIAHLAMLLESLLQNKNLIKFYNDLCENDLIMMEKLKVDFKFGSEQKKYFYYFWSAVIFYISSETVVLCTFLLREEIELVGYWVAYFFPYLVCCFR